MAGSYAATRLVFAPPLTEVCLPVGSGGIASLGLVAAVGYLLAKALTRKK
jgi:hypothetical protein